MPYDQSSTPYAKPSKDESVVDIRLWCRRMGARLWHWCHRCSFQESIQAWWRVYKLRSKMVASNPQKMVN
ncbi:hypothetical protein RJT34_07278 [Clitoria ternatea]|uniref:Uncharacterized protein n=1 Tax=Clitoria ternatea TaxID=43366 RepID=A0AAN9K2H8_CLITE